MSVDAPDCRLGYACQRACISRSKECQVELGDKEREYGQWLDRTNPNPAPKPPTLPKGVRREEDEDSGETSYSFMVGNKGIQLYFSGIGVEESGVSDVGFYVDGDYEMNRDAFSESERSQISRTLIKAFQYHIATMGNGTLSCNAWADGDEAYRAYSYELMGFSRPLYGSPGSTQFAVVKDGKIDPDASRNQLIQKEGTGRTDYNDKLWYGDPNSEDEDERLGAIGRMQRQRKADRAKRRAKK